jgi:hypothetical protein
LLTAGEQPDSPAVAKALDHLRRFNAEDLGRVSSVSLPTMAFAAADPDKYRLEIVANVFGLEHAQIQPGDGQAWVGSWTYDDAKRTPGDNSNSQFTLMALNAASKAGVKVDAKTWTLAPNYWLGAQRPDGGFSSMANAPELGHGQHDLRGGLEPDHHRPEAIAGAGDDRRRADPRRRPGWGEPARRGGHRPARDHFHVGQNVPRGARWEYDSLDGLERTGRLAGFSRAVPTEPEAVSHASTSLGPDLETAVVEAVPAGLKSDRGVSAVQS